MWRNRVQCNSFEQGVVRVVDLFVVWGSAGQLCAVMARMKSQRAELWKIRHAAALGPFEATLATDNKTACQSLTMS